jgi:hypothetical protein
MRTDPAFLLRHPQEERTAALSQPIRKQKKQLKVKIQKKTFDLFQKTNQKNQLVR